MKRMKRFLVLILAAGLLSSAWALSDIAQFAEKQEQQIQAYVEKEKVPLRRQQAEFLYRQNYANALQRKQEVLLRSGTLTTEKVEALREERRLLMEQLQALDKQIKEASMEAPEIVELQAIIEANNNRIVELHKSIMPKAESSKQTDAQP
jgi:hypothetical protein